MLRDVDLGEPWDEATDHKRRLLIEELVERVVVFADHLEVTTAGTPRLNVRLAEPGLSHPSQDRFLRRGESRCHSSLCCRPSVTHAECRLPFRASWRWPICYRTVVDMASRGRRCWLVLPVALTVSVATLSPVCHAGSGALSPHDIERLARSIPGGVS